MDKKILYCDSRGDRRFSAFYAEVSVCDGLVRDSIENIYQGCKLDAYNNFNPGKGKPVAKCVDPFKPFNEKGEYILLKPTELTRIYESLWREYFKENPELLAYAAEFDIFIDRFRGHCRNCQADIIEKLVKEYKLQLK